jgi:hypothetical protein
MTHEPEILEQSDRALDREIYHLKQKGDTFLADKLHELRELAPEEAKFVLIELVLFEKTQIGPHVGKWTQKSGEIRLGLFSGFRRQFASAAQNRRFLKTSSAA